MANHQTAATLGVQLSLETGNFVTEANKVAYETQKMKNAIAREMRAADKEIQTLKYATEDYGKTVSKVTLLERELATGRLKNLSQSESGKEKVAQLLAQAAAYDKITQSQKKMTGVMNEQQKLQLTYQATDLFTQIASGQNPMIALIQQGGQLKDAMGGLGNMFRMLGTFITPFNVLVTGAVAAVGGLALAMYQGSEESKKFLNSLALTNGFAGITLNSFDKLSESISKKYNISIGETRDIFQDLVASGNFTYKSLDSVAGAIARISKLSGEDADVVTSKLIPALDGTARSAKSLNDKYHFLNLEQYKQIELLEQQGKYQEAVKLTTDLLTQSLDGQGKKLGYLEQMWKAVKTAGSDFWDWAKSVGREVDPTVSALNEQKALMESYVRLGGEGATKGFRYQAALAEYKRLAKLIEEQENQARAKSEQKEKDALKIGDRAATGGAGTPKKLDAEYEKIKYQAAIEAAKATATEEEKIALDASVKMVDKIYQYRMHSEQEFRANGGQLQRNLIAEIGAITAERDRKISDEKYKQYQKELDAQIAAMRNDEAFQQQRNQAQIDYVQKNYLAYKAVEETQKSEREILQLKHEAIGATEKEIELRKIDIELARQRALIAANSAGQRDSDVQEAYRLADAIALQKKSTLELADTYKKTQQTFDTVWGNMSSAIDNFVRTGKLSMKDFARSVIQDLIAIQMKAAALSFLRMMFGGNPLASSSYGSSGGISEHVFNPGQVRASGGSVTNNTPYLVGEKGPELFMPSGSGTIIPNGQMSQMGGVTNVTNNYINAIDTKSFEQRLLSSSNAVWAANQYAGKNMPTNFGRT